MLENGDFSAWEGFRTGSFYEGREKRGVSSQAKMKVKVVYELDEGFVFYTVTSAVK